MATQNPELIRLNLGPNQWLEGDCRFPVGEAADSTDSGGQRDEPLRLRDFAVVYVHGFGSVRNGDKAKAFAAACAERGWPFAAFDMRGHGTSSGHIHDLLPSQLLEDLEVVRDFLEGRGARQLCLIGSSMGGWAAAWFALGNHERVAACALLAPAFHFPSARWDRLNATEREEWRRAGVIHVKNEWLDVELGYGIVEEIPLFPHKRLLENHATPTLIFHGLRDEVVPPAHTLEFVEKCKYPQIELHLFKDGDHRLSEHRVEMAEATCSFFERVLRGKVSESQLG